MNCIDFINERFFSVFFKKDLCRLKRFVFDQSEYT